MSVVKAAVAHPSARWLTLSAALAAGAAAAWWTGMGEDLWLTAVYGPICGGHAAGAPHCAACYVALGLLAAAVPPGLAALRGFNGE